MKSSKQQREKLPAPSCLSIKSDHSFGRYINFKDESHSCDPVVDHKSSEVTTGQSSKQHLASIFMLLEENISHFCEERA
ncbi:hypothetical protein JOQ06_019754 [Pogonophryne albipinna]|uniref:Uncharacterized protein n=1 Tax=Pogonophryne albipinna TaxID=1090488 RepID=A0AAD6BQX9_9TELE|nr:hypothetical protein JOQ06_019754 [Pogonophryne albipinna]